MYPYDLKEDLLVRLELNSSEKVSLCTGDTSATYKLSDILLKYDAIFDKPHATTIAEMYTGTISIPYTKITSIHYQALSKKTLPARLTLITYLFVHSRAYFFTDNFPKKMKNFTIQASRKF